MGQSTIHIKADRKDARCSGLIKSFKYLLKSKYLICIATIVFMYNISMNMIEIVWKDQVRELYTNRMDFMIYSGKKTNPDFTEKHRHVTRISLPPAGS